MVFHSRHRVAGAGALLVSAIALSNCRDRPTAPPAADTTVKPSTGLTPRELIEVTIAGIGSAAMTASARSLPLTEPGTANLSAPANGNGTGNGLIQMELASSGGVTEGVRGKGGTRYLYATFRVRNAQRSNAAYNTPRQNLTLIAVANSTTLNGTAVKQLLRGDNTAAPASIATSVIPAGAVFFDDSMRVRSMQTDVLQVFTEAEVAALTLPAGTTAFPYGFVVRNVHSTNTRTLPASPSVNEFDGVVTLAFRYTLPNFASQDPYSVTLVFVAADDAETRITESLEEAQDASSRAAFAARAVSLGATTATTLGGSPIRFLGGVRRICSFRTAGLAGSPTQTNLAPGAYSRIEVYRPGETYDQCGDSWRGNPSSVIGINTPYQFTARAMDRYGNVLTTAVDTIGVVAGGPMVVGTASGAFAAGERQLTITYNAYDDVPFDVVGRRTSTRTTVTVRGIGRTWTGASSSDFSNNGNWAGGVCAAARDTVYVPSGLVTYPALDANYTVGGLQVTDGGIFNLNAFNLTVTGRASAGFSGGVQTTTGRLVLTGIAQTMEGQLGMVTVTGTYSLTANVTLKAPLRVDAGRVTSSAFRIQGSSF